MKNMLYFVLKISNENLNGPVSVFNDEELAMNECEKLNVNNSYGVELNNNWYEPLDDIVDDDYEYYKVDVLQLNKPR